MSDFRAPFFAVEDAGLVHFIGIRSGHNKNEDSFYLERVSACGDRVWKVPWQFDPDCRMQRSGKDISCLGCLANMTAGPREG